MINRNNNQAHSSQLESTPVLNFYSGKTIFVTGFSGFLGKVLVEKLLRSVDVQQIYVLLRNKRGLSFDERSQAILTSPPFTFHDKTLLNTYKVVPVQGDLSLPNLGISSNMLKILQKEVSIIFHSAADVRFDADISSNIVNNVNGTKSLIEMAKTFELLESFVHISTAYSFCDRINIDEKVYPLNTTVEEIQELLRSQDSDHIKRETKRLLIGRPNSYTLTKALSENVIVQNRGNITFSIVRPAIITPSIKEPVEGWVDTIQGFQGISLAAQIGLLQTVNWNYWAKIEFVPADYCANFAIVAGWSTRVKRPNELVVYNLTVSANKRNNSWGELFTIGRDAALAHPSTKQLRPLMSPPKYKQARITYPIEKFIYHTFFGLIIDLILSILGYNTFMYRQAKKLNKGLELVEFFTTHEFEIECTNYTDTVNNLSAKDYEVFSCDPFAFDENHYPLILVNGFKKFFLKEDEKDTPKARKQVVLICLMYRFVQILFLWIIGKAIFSFIMFMVKEIV